MTRTYDMANTSFTENVNKKVNEFREGLYIAIPATVVGVQDYETLQCLDVVPVINDIYTRKDASVLKVQTLRKVFVKLHNAGGWKFNFPVAIGDKATLHWSHKDLSKWLDGDGGNVDQSVTELAELNDCWIELGFGTRKVNNKPSLTDVVLEGPATKITVTPEGVVTAETSGTSYLKSSHHTIDTDVTITKNLLVEGNTTTNGNNTTDGNTLTKGTTESTGIITATSGVYAASYAGLGGGGATFNVDMGITGTVTINGVVINTHTHNVILEGQPTGGPQNA